jgi:hypothetical protein
MRMPGRFRGGDVKKTHCDVCDVVLKEIEANGRVNIGPLDSGRGDGYQPMELCPKHYLSFKETVREWRKTQ